MSKKEIKIYFVMLVVLGYLLGATVYIVQNYTESFKLNVVHKGLILKSMASKIDQENAYINVNLYETWFNKDRWCMISADEEVDLNADKWEKVESNVCNLKFESGAKYVYLKDNNENIARYTISDYINKIISFDVSVNDTLILKGDKEKIQTSIIAIGNPDETINYEVKNEKIAKVENGYIVGLKDGKTDITIYDNYGHSETITMMVTSLVRKAKLDNNKKFLGPNTYTTEQAKTLDEILFYRVEKAGLKTRAGVVAAARFLVLEFKYRVPYFLENGRLFYNGHSDYVDGEGRYYHRGLYLSKDKYKTIKSSMGGPKYWGEYLIEYSNDNRIMKNGLDCSGFVVWSIVNGGFNPGDRGAGLNPGDEDIVDLGKSQKITMKLLKSGKVKAGDLIGFNGHIGIIIGVEQDHITVADTLYYEKGTIATRFTFSELINKSGFTHIYDMSNYYKEDGNYTAMWN